MTILDLTIEIIGTIAGWAAVILGLAWAARHFSRRDIYIIHKSGGDDGSGHRPDPAPDPFPGRRVYPKIFTGKSNRRITWRR